MIWFVRIWSNIHCVLVDRMFWIAYYADLWVYPILEVLNWPQRILFLVTCWLLMFACYFVGELLTGILWRECHLALYSVSVSIVYLCSAECFDTVGWATGRASGLETGCWFVGGDDLTGALHDLLLQLSSCHHHLHHPLLQ